MKDERFSFSDCTLTRSMAVIGTKWKPIIVWVIQDRKIRFGQLDAYISLITRKVLTEQLKELEEDGLVIREAFSETPPRVEYSLTKKGLDLLPILSNVVEWYDNYEPNEKYKVIKKEKVEK
ncbi:MAG: helix-turn-helix domain-containing protein [Bacteroidota bacterium]